MHVPAGRETARGGPDLSQKISPIIGGAGRPGFEERAAMDLTRLSELLDLADNTVLAPYEARELADEMANLRAATEWTAETPTRPGLYGWRVGPDTVAILVRVVVHPGGKLTTNEDDPGKSRDVSELGGLWSVPVAR
jgi:hypothetical protein